MVAADFRSFVDAQRQAERLFQDRPKWLRASILNSAHSGRFSTDRTMRDYNRDIWHLTPVTLKGD
jgi:starch phosphorylase